MPVAIDLFCGLGGWAEGFLAEGWDVIGFDIERHNYGSGGYPGQLVLQDVLTIHGSQFRDAAVIVASPPCQNYSYMAMPWKRAKAMAVECRESAERMERLNALFNACFRIHREAISATGSVCKECDGSGVIERRVAYSEKVDEPCPACDGIGAVGVRYIPLIVENVKGAQPWVGSAKWHYGSYYLWGDVPALMPFSNGRKVQHHLNGAVPPSVGKTSWFHGNRKHELRDGIKNTDTEGRTWFGVSHGKQYPKQPGNPVNGVKIGGARGDDRFAHHNRDEFLERAGVKQGGEWWHDPGSKTRRFSSRSAARKAASAQIAKIPYELAAHIARVFKLGGAACADAS